MSETTLTEFIRYNNWANAQVFATCLELTPDQLAASTSGSYGSIHRTLGHLVSAEADYVNRLTGEGPQPAFRWEDGPAVADIVAFASQVSAALLNAVQCIPPTQLVHEEDGGLFMEYHARHLFMQAINHGIEHRTNITTTLSGLGIPTPEVDGWGYLSAHPDRFEMKEGSL